MMRFYALVTLCLSGSALAILEWGPCPDVAPMPNFALPKLEGRWYEARRYFTLTEFSAKCVVSEMSLGPNGTMLSNSTAISSLNGRQYVAPEVVIRSPYSSDPGMLKVKIPGLSYALPTYLVLGTDYNSHVVSYVCINLEVAHVKMLWVGTREKEPSTDTLNKAIQVIKNHKLNDKLLMKTDQKDCEPFEMEVTE